MVQCDNESGREILFMDCSHCLGFDKIKFWTHLYSNVLAQCHAKLSGKWAFQLKLSHNDNDENKLTIRILCWCTWSERAQRPDDISGSKGKALLFCKDGQLEICLRRTKLCLQWEKELVARQRLVSPWWQRWSLCWSHTGVSWSAVGVGGTWSLPWSERWSVGEVGLSKLVRALVGQWGKCFLAERKTHSRSPGWNLEDISWDSF